MDCKDINKYLYPFLDGELDNQASQMIKGHLLGCPLCKLELEGEKRVDSLIKQNVPKEKTPYELMEAILKQIEKRREGVGRFAPPVLKSALIGVLGVVLVFILFALFHKPFPVYSEAINEHIKFSQGKIPIEIFSNRPPEVHRWFLAKLDFKIMIPNLSPQGMELRGARVCNLKGKKSAYIMYGKGKHNISVFMFDAKTLKFPKAKKIAVNNKAFHLYKEKGYNSVLWVDDGIACVFVSDLDEAELLYLASL